MSYIRLTSSGQYCDLGENGSQRYVWSTGEMIHSNPGTTISRSELAGAVMRVFEEVGAGTDEIEQALADKFGGCQQSDSYPYPRPEMGEIACRIVDNRIDVNVPQRAFKDIGDTFQPSYEQCDFCGDDTRASSGQKTSCGKDSCSQKYQEYKDEQLADNLGLDSADELEEDLDADELFGDEQLGS